MKDPFIEWMQQQLKLAGGNPGQIDGIWGRKTRTDLLAFQKKKLLPQSGIGDTATVNALRAVGKTTPPKDDLFARYPWMQLALSKKGLLEGRDNAELRSFLKSDGKTLGDPSKLPWCGDFVETCVALALPNEALPTNPYLARNWIKFGRQVTPGFGTVLVFWRTHKTKSTNGHVGFYVGEDATYYYVLGGNQSNGVSIVKIAKNRLLGARAPVTVPNFVLEKVQMNDAGPVSTNEA